MAEITAALVKQLRERTGAGMMECKKALVESKGDIGEAEVLLRKWGIASAGKKAARTTRQGLIGTYIHAGGQLGVLVEINCESDFVARTEDFIALCKDLALHIAATNPRYLKIEDVPEAEIAESGETPEKFYEQYVLMAQPYIKDGSRTIEEKIKETVAKVRENIVVRRFVRYEIGG